MARVKIDPKKPHPEGFEASAMDTSTMDLRDYLTKKKSTLPMLLWTAHHGSTLPMSLQLLREQAVSIQSVVSYPSL